MRESRRQAKMVAMRTEIVRVARRLGLPEGHAPGYTQMQQHGPHPQTIQRRVGGLKLDGKSPLIGWPETLRRLGLRPPPEELPPTRMEVFDDLLRVSAMEGRPGKMPSSRKYQQHGAYCYKLVMRTLAPHDPCWANAARAIQLEPYRTRRPRRRKDAAA